MGQPVYTKLGYCVDEDLMDCVVETVKGDNFHKVTTRWLMKGEHWVGGVKVAEAGELMREDAAPSILAGLGSKAIGGPLG